MTAQSIDRWRGMVALTESAVVGASRAVERVHLETARRPFAVLARIPLVNLPAAVVRVVHDVTVTSVHGLIRLTAHAVGTTLVAVLDAGGMAVAGDHDHSSSEKPAACGIRRSLSSPAIEKGPGPQVAAPPPGGGR